MALKAAVSRDLAIVMVDDFLVVLHSCVWFVLEECEEGCSLVRREDDCLVRNGGAGFGVVRRSSCGIPCSVWVILGGFRKEQCSKMMMKIYVLRSG